MNAKDDKETSKGPAKIHDTHSVTMADTTYIWYLGLTNFLNKIGTLGLLSFFFWVGFMYLMGATILLIGWTYGPRINGRLVCPANSQVWLMVVLWYIMALICVLTSYGYSTIETLDTKAFENISRYVKWVGFFVRVVPTWTRLIHIFNYGQLSVVGLQLLFLPECNKVVLTIIYSITLGFWFGIVVFGVYAKRRIFVPPFIYCPIEPGYGIALDLHKMMRSLGP